MFFFLNKHQYIYMNFCLVSLDWKKVVFYTNITLLWWLLFLEQICTKTSYSDFHTSVLKPYWQKFTCLQNASVSAGLFIRKWSDIVKKRHTQQILQLCHSPEVIKSSNQDDQLLNILDMPRTEVLKCSQRTQSYDSGNHTLLIQFTNLIPWQPRDLSF